MGGVSAPTCFTVKRVIRPGRLRLPRSAQGHAAGAPCRGLPLHAGTRRRARLRAPCVNGGRGGWQGGTLRVPLVSPSCFPWNVTPAHTSVLAPHRARCAFRNRRDAVNFARATATHGGDRVSPCSGLPPARDVVFPPSCFPVEPALMPVGARPSRSFGCLPQGRHRHVSRGTVAHARRRSPFTLPPAGMSLFHRHVSRETTLALSTGTFNRRNSAYSAAPRPPVDGLWTARSPKRRRSSRSPRRA